MANLLPTFTDHDYKNWLKGGLGLKYAREGIEIFITRNIDNFHQDILTNLPVGQPHCNGCSTENIIQCNNGNKFCKYKKNKCKVHDVKYPTRKSRPCANLVCDVIRDEIVRKHRFNGPSWANTDASCWCRDPWQLAVCYMPSGYATAHTASETDFPGLLSVAINNKVFDKVVTDKLSSKNNVFCKVTTNSHYFTTNFKA